MVKKKVLTSVVLSVITLALSSSAHAGFLVGQKDGVLFLDDVNDIIGDYNLAEDPDLPLATSLFKKTDDHKTFVFDLTNGFKFFSDAAGTVPVLTESALTSLTTAYFSYTGPALLAYYSLKSSDVSELYTFSSGLNLLQVSANDPLQGISHVSFWIGPPIPSGGPLVPAPASLILWSMGGGMAFCGQKLRRRQNSKLAA